MVGREFRLSQVDAPHASGKDFGAGMLRRMVQSDNGNVHRAAAKIIVSKSRAARGSVCNVLLSRVWLSNSV
jgi:hypothetical protein